MKYRNIAKPETPKKKKKKKGGGKKKKKKNGRRRLLSVDWLIRGGGMLTTAFNARLIRCGRFNKGDIRQGVAIRHIVIIKIKRFYIA